MTKKYIISWNVGYGPNHDVVEADNEDEASKYAYEAVKQYFEDNVEYSCEGEATDKLLEEYGLQ